MQVITIGDQFDRLSSHWCYDTPNFTIVSRVYFDLPDFFQRFTSILASIEAQVLCFSGKTAASIASQIYNWIYLSANKKIKDKYRSLIKAVRLQNTNLAAEFFQSQYNTRR